MVVPETPGACCGIGVTEVGPSSVDPCLPRNESSGLSGQGTCLTWGLRTAAGERPRRAPSGSCTESLTGGVETQGFHHLTLRLRPADQTRVVETAQLRRILRRRGQGVPERLFPGDAEGDGLERFQLLQRSVSRIVEAQLDLAEFLDQPGW